MEHRPTGAPPVDPEDLDRARSAAAAAQDAADAADRSLLRAAAAILEPLESGFLSPSCGGCCCGGFDDSDLLRYDAMVSATPEKLAAWCHRGREETALLLQLFQLPENPAQERLQLPSLGAVRSSPAADTGACARCCGAAGCGGRLGLLSFYEAGCPRHAEYGRAAQLYRELVPASGEDGNDPVLDRLALAVALELCCEVDPWDQPVERNRPDPHRRYAHYRDAYRKGNELDPAFSGLTAWELRMAVNSDASERELQWGRDCLRNYRPDIVTMDDPQWRYCWIVRQDVDYKDPDWFKPQRSYDQILSGGGECGPRAWFGR
jgi:hypothetical protein